MTSTGTTHWRWPLRAALLPRDAGMRYLRGRVRIAHEPPAEAEAAWAQASAFGLTAIPETAGRPADRGAWLEAWRLTRLVDHADLFLHLTRSARWIDANVRVDGAWPARDPFLAVTSHWGAGLWSLRHLRRHGHAARFLQRRLDLAALAPDPWLARYARLRVQATRRALGTALIYTGAAAAEIAATWGRGQSVVALFDVPAERGRSTIALPLGALAIRVPLGLLRLACAHGVPVVPFAMGVDRGSGERTLTIGAAAVHEDPGALGAVLAQQLHALLQADSAAWHLWPHAGGLLSRAAP